MIIEIRARWIIEIHARCNVVTVRLLQDAGSASCKSYLWWLTHWGWATHICVGKLTIIGSENGLSPGRRQAIIWTVAEILLIRPLWTNFSEILIEVYTFSFKKMHSKMSSGKWRPFCPGLNVLSKVAAWKIVWLSMVTVCDMYSDIPV